ncbi:hypothetical protein ASPVEDRAFT_26118 [Aspergillus versicolor CBS 583.65]|uniref:Amino acid permease/ SLC12A domain-containing protein n=1 Tax=Aspergillus versicolor CBS 583.65 TaxID=1036611 RepID=A0A1L9PCN8_ASPVE|nr:uncharacterized protein ASPVEDRAFT_26118 [Aspergillus versicolor CBS 583.65]OJI99297.1 hypothetical protein ASPVEDRAFT_26118 [Aspergillus versicolor CBS 583.65]
MNNLASLKCCTISSAFITCIDNTGGIIGSYMYLDKEAPIYLTGFGLLLAFGESALLVATLFELFFMYGNKRNANLTETGIREKYTDEQLLAMGGRSPLFNCTL